MLRKAVLERARAASGQLDQLFDVTSSHDHDGSLCLPSVMPSPRREIMHCMSTPATNQRFSRAVHNTMEMLRALAEAVTMAPERNGGTPAAGSVAGKELGHEAGYSSRCAWEHPVSDSHSAAGFALQAACDHARSYASLFDAEHVAVYSHMVVARAALEACTVSWWLSEPAIKTNERIQRGLSEQLFSAHQLVYLDMAGDDWAGRVKFWTDVAQDLGWTVSEGWGGRQQVNGVCRPQVTKAIDELTEGGKSGHGLYCTFSAVTHSTWYGLRQGLVAGKDLGGGMVSAAVGSESVTVESQAWLLLGALRRTADRRFELMGWQDVDWRAVSQRTRHYELSLAAKLVKQRGLA